MLATIGSLWPVSNELTCARLVIPAPWFPVEIAPGHCHTFKMQRQTTNVYGLELTCLLDMSETKGRGDTHNDQTNEKMIEHQKAVRQDLWNKHLQSPALALSAALRRVAECEGAGSSTDGGSRN